MQHRMLKLQKTTELVKNKHALTRLNIQAYHNIKVGNECIGQAPIMLSPKVAALLDTPWFLVFAYCFSCLWQHSVPSSQCACFLALFGHNEFTLPSSTFPAQADCLVSRGQDVFHYDLAHTVNTQHSRLISWSLSKNEKNEFFFIMVPCTQHTLPSFRTTIHIISTTLTFIILEL